MVVPAGFSLPPLPYLLAILAAVAVVGALLVRVRPPVTARHAVALAPWMAAGACLRVLNVVDAIPPAVEPFFGAPAVYLSTFSLAGAVWLVGLAAFEDGDGLASTPALLGAAGAVVLLLLVGVALSVGASRGSLRAAWPVVGLLAAALLAALLWAGMRVVVPSTTAATGAVGLLAVFGHALDGVSTAIGIDVLRFGEQSPLSRSILEFAATLPTADLLGSGWLFVLVKATLAVAVVQLFADYVREDPSEGFLLLAVVAAVGLGPGVHNLLLFAITG